VLDQNSVISAQADGITYGSETINPGQDWQASTWTEGAQFILLEGVSVTAGSPLILYSSPGATELAVLNGLQVRQTSQRSKRIKPLKVERPPNDALLNVDFAAPEVWLGMAATGNGSTDYWNSSYTPYQYFAELFDLKWSTGLLSGVSATVENAPGAWTNEHPDGMMNTFMHSFGFQPVIVTLTDLPNGTYDVYAYIHGVLDQNSMISAEADGVTYGPETSTIGAEWQSPTWTEGAQYILLEDVSVIAGSPLIIRSSPGATELAVLNGLQLRQTSQRVKKAKPARVAKPSKNALLNIDFANPEPWFGMAATGNGSGDYWNRSYAPYQYFAELFDLKWSCGLLSGVSATVENAPGAWTNEHPDGMMNTFTHSFGYQPISVTLTDLPRGTYDVYVYAHGVLDQNSIISAEVNGVMYAPEATITSSDWQSPLWTEGSQYILLENLSVVSGSPLIIHSAPGVTELATLNGLQLRLVSKK